MTELYRRLLALRDVPGLFEVDVYEDYEASAVGGDGASLLDCDSDITKDSEHLPEQRSSKLHSPHVRTAEGYHVETAEEQWLCDKIQIDVLGRTTDGSIKVFSGFHRCVEVIKDISRLSYENLLAIAGPPAKAFVVRKFPKDQKDKPEDTYDMNDVRESISFLAGYRTIGKQTELGVGCWAGVDDAGRQDGSVTIVGVGEAAEWTTNHRLVKITHPRCRNHLLDFNSSGNQWYDFDKLSELLANCDQAFADRTKDELVELFSKWRWKHPKQAPSIMAGLVFATWIQSLWEWRPQIALTGPSKAGKTFLANCLSNIFGPLCIKSSHSTKAGILQAIQNSSKVMLCDEFENSRYRDEILETLRASGRGDSILRGTADQKGHGYSMRHIVWVAAIEVGLSREADKNRFIMLELVRPEESQKGKLVLPTPKELGELGLRSLAVAIKYANAARAMAVRLKDVRIEGVDDRIVESYAVPAAMLAVIDDEIDDNAKEIERSMLSGMELADVGESKDESALMDAILSSHVFSGRESYAVAQLLDVAINKNSGHEEASRALAKCGIKVDTYGEGEEVRLLERQMKGGDPDFTLKDSECLVISYRTVSKHLLRNTAWENQSIEQILKRIGGAILMRRRVGSHRAKAIVLPMKAIKEEFLGIEENTASAETNADQQYEMATSGGDF